MLIIEGHEGREGWVFYISSDPTSAVALFHMGITRRCLDVHTHRPFPTLRLVRADNPPSRLELEWFDSHRNCTVVSKVGIGGE